MHWPSLNSWWWQQVAQTPAERDWLLPAMPFVGAFWYESEFDIVTRAIVRRENKAIVNKNGFFVGI
jgi:hypothetical protein